MNPRRLTAIQRHQLNMLLLSKKESLENEPAKMTMEEFTKELSKELGFEMGHTSVAESLQILGINRKRANPRSGTYIKKNRSRILAKELAKLLKELGMPVSEELKDCMKN